MAKKASDRDLTVTERINLTKEMRRLQDALRTGVCHAYQWRDASKEVPHPGRLCIVKQDGDPAYAVYRWAGKGWSAIKGGDTSNYPITHWRYVEYES